MGIFGNDTRVITTTRQSSTDRRTNAEAGGLAAQNVGGDLIFETASDEALALAFEFADSVNARAFDVTQAAGGVVAQASENAVEIVAASKGVEKPDNTPLFLLAGGVLLFFLIREGVL